MKEKFKKEITFEPAFDRRNKNPKINYGIHGVTIRFLLTGSLGVVQFVLFSNWHLPHVTKEMRKDLKPENYFLFEPLPVDLGYHSPKPMYEGHRAMGEIKYKWREPTLEEQASGFKSKMPESIETGTFEPCPYLGGQKCYYDGSGLNAERIYKILLEKGSEGVWEELEKYYKYTFIDKE